MRLCPKCYRHYGDDASKCEDDGVLTTQSPTLLTDVKEIGEAPKPGTVIGNYRLLGIIGAGGMGYVYLAEHMRLGRKVALKMLRPELTDNADIRARFFAEARAVNAIRHDSVVEITDFIDEGPYRYFVMELLGGQTLKERMRHGPMPLPVAIHVALQLADVLSAAHKAGVVHRDLKPGNVILIRRGNDPNFVKLLDFGIAKVSGSGARTDDAKTLAGQFLGTPAFMSPEQLSEEPIDHRADIYSFGVLLFLLVTGRLPFTAPSVAQVIAMHLKNVPPAPSSLLPVDAEFPDRLDALILRCLEKDRAARPENMIEIAAELSVLMDDVGPPPSSDDSNSIPNLRAPTFDHRTNPTYTAEHGLRSATSEHGLRRVPGAVPRPALRVAAIATVVALVIGVSGAFLFFRGDAEVPVAVERAPDSPVDEPAPKAAPARIRIAFTSTPPGAEIVLETEGAIGTTPLSHDFAVDALPQVVELRLAGHHQERIITKPSDTVVDATLRALPRRGQPVAGEGRDKKPNKRPKLKDGALLDPFAED